MSPYGNVLRIVVFNKNGVQSLVEFQDANSAVQAYTALDGKDVSGIL
jgi:heterogeneous nuclear ribonucleoprotein L